MPELPEVETVRRGLAPAMEGHAFTSVTLNRDDLRFPFPPDFVQRLTGQRVERLARRAKFLVVELSRGDILTMHLGMTGRFTIERSDGDTRRPGDFVYASRPDPTHDHVRFTFDSGSRIVFNDPRRFGFMELFHSDEIELSDRFRRLGPEPLGNSFSPDYLSSALRGKKTPIKSALLDQRIVAGLGNIYVCEALFRAGISPRRSAHTVSGKRSDRLVRHIRDVLTEAIEAGGSSLRDYAHADGSLGYFQHTFAVYGREAAPCPNCAAPVKRLVQAGRSSFYCGTCQR